MIRTTRATQVLTLLLVALSMGLEFAHTLELGPKLTYSPQLYLRLNTSLYAWFGPPPPLGAAIWLGAIVAARWLWRSLDRVIRDTVGYQYGTVRRLFNVSSTRR